MKNCAPDATRDNYSWLPWEDAATTIARLQADVTRLEGENDGLRAEVARMLGDVEVTG